MLDIYRDESMVWVDKNMKRLLLIILILALLGAPAIALASDISGALFYGVIQISNNGTATNNVATTCNISTTSLIDSSYLNASANNCAIRNSSGADVIFMPGYTPNNELWSIWVPSIGGYGNQKNILYTAESTGGEIRYFPGAGGMTTPDNATIEPTDNFTVELQGWVDTTAGVGKSLVRKREVALDIYVSDTISGNITASIDARNDLSYDGNDYLEDATGVTTPAGATITLEGWIYFDGLGNQELLIACGNTAGFSSWFIGKDAAGQVYVRIGNVGGTAWAASFASTNTLNAATWYYLTVSYDANATPELEVYVNGDSWAGADGGDGTNIFQPNIRLEIGASWAAGFANFVTGDIDEVRISDVARTQAEHQTNYNNGLGIPFTVDANTVSLWHFNEGAGNPIDETGTNALTLNGATWSSTSPVEGHSAGTAYVSATGVSSGEHTIKVSNEPALDFVDTNSDHFWVADHADFSFTDGAGNDEPFSFVVWLNSENVTGLKTVIAKHSNAAVKTEYAFYFNSNYLYIAAYELIGLKFIGRRTGSLLAYVGEWIHLVVTYDGTEANSGFNIYVNGVDSDTADYETLPYTGMSNSPQRFEVGSRNSGAEWFLDGKIAEIKVYSDELTPAELLADFNGTHKTTNLVAWYQLDDGSGNPLDASGNNHDGTNVGADWVSTGLIKIFIDDTLEDFDTGAPVPNNAYDWTGLQNNVMPHIEYQRIWIGDTLRQDIEWEYSDVFTDLSGSSNNATPTFRSASSGSNVTAELISFQPLVEARAPSYVLADAPPFIDSDITGNVTSPFTTAPPAGTFPLAGVVTAIANATATPSQLPLLIIAAFTILATSLTVSATMRKYGSGTILVKLMVITVIMGIFIALEDFAIDFWMLVICLIMGTAFGMASRQIGWN